MDSSNPSQNHIVPGENQADLIISSLLYFPNASPPSISSSFDRVLDKALASASGDDSVKDRLVDRTLQLTSLLLESTKQCFRKRAAIHNSTAWPFPPELTVKVFSMLDTKSLMQVAACCTMFRNCAMDRSSYSHIDLTTAAKFADDGVVCTMILRAGKELRSLKLGRVTRTVGSTSSLLTGSCLAPLSYNHGFIGNHLRSLQLYNLRSVNYKALTSALSACSNITDLKIVGLFKPYDLLLQSLTKKCCLIEHLFLETYSSQCRLDSRTGSALVEFVTSCPSISSLTLIRFGLDDALVQNLVKGSRKLKYMNLSRTPIIKGHFLRDLGHSCKDSPLDTLILRNCPHLEEKEVLQFLNSLLTGDLSFIRRIDVSNIRGLASDAGRRSYEPKFPVEKLKEERPSVTLVANFNSLVPRGDKDEEEVKLIEMTEDVAEEFDDEDEDEDESDYESDEDHDFDDHILL